MPAIAARLITRPRRGYPCVTCDRWLTGPHVRVYGYGEVGDPPYTVRQCVPCARQTALYDAKIKKVVDQKPEVEHG